MAGPCVHVVHDSGKPHRSQTTPCKITLLAGHPAAPNRAANQVTQTGSELPRIMTRESVSLSRPVVWGKLETKNPISINIPLLEIPFFASK